MRNWNMSYTGLKRGCMLDCEPTYEELKLAFVAFALLGSASNCEPTYEELKQLFEGRFLAIIIFIASLPMRNWNRKPPARSLAPAQIASLPMRNWNHR